MTPSGPCPGATPSSRIPPGSRFRPRLRRARRGSCACASTMGRCRRGSPTRPDEHRADLRVGCGQDRGDHPAPGFRRCGPPGNARPGQGGARPRRVLRHRARSRLHWPSGASPRGARRAARAHGWRAVSTFDLLADLPLRVDGYSLEGLRRNVSSGFERLTTVVHLRGDGVEGLGEDVVYDAPDHVALQEAGAAHDLAGSYTLGDFCAHVDTLDLFPVPPAREVSRLYRRWTFHSAALDLALRQAGQSLWERLGREPQPVTFVVSLRLGEPPTLEPIERRLERYPTLRFKLDPTSSWTPELIASLVATGAVDSVDFKSLYTGTIVDQPPDPVLYRRVVDAFPNAWIEDPDVVTPESAAVLASEHDRITWDASIHGVDDIEALPFPPKMVNL